MKEELDLEPYRQAWQAEKQRLQAAPPKHSEQDIAAMLTQHKRPSRTLPLWFGSAAASVAILVAVTWLLWLRPEPVATDFPTMAELHPTVISPTSNRSQPFTTDTPVRPLVAPPSIAKPTSSLLEFSMSDITVSSVSGYDTLFYNNDDVQNIVLSDVQPTAPTTPAKPQLQAFQETNRISNINKQKTPKDMPVRTKEVIDESYALPNNMQVSLSSGVSFSQTASPQALMGVTITRDTKSNGILCANNQGSLYLLLDLPIVDNDSLISVCLQYGFGLSCLPTEDLTLRLNMGGYILLGDFDLGLRLNTEASYRIADHLTLTAGYQYYVPGIVSGDSRHAAILSIGYIIN